jgi:glycosyltransferase involved in cell wall biosynthesis
MAEAPAFTVIVATYGDDAWAELAAARAIPSAERQDVRAEVLHVHGARLHEARNFGAEQARGEWLCFLDADDELAPGYLAAMARADGDLRTPAVQWVHEDHEDPPRLLTPKPLIQGNYLVIGTLIRRAMFLELGGFADWPIYEDWDLFLRCAVARARIEQVPEAVYRAWARADGRNNGELDLRSTTYSEIRRRHYRAYRRVTVHG